MAIYHCKVQVISRGKGRNSIASAAYRARTKLKDPRTGTTHDYRHRGGLSHDEILTPKNVPERLKDRQTLWAEVEKSEKRINSRVAREFIVALPKELNQEENIELTRNFAKEQFVKQGMIADVCLHDLSTDNPHAHIMLTTRHVDENGFKKEKKSARTWNKTELLEDQRSAWSAHVNQALEKANIDARVDHRSWKDKGVDRISQVHLGWYANNLEQQGIATELGDLNREIASTNEEIKQLNEEIRISTKKLNKLRELEKIEKAMTAYQISESTMKPEFHKQRKTKKQKSNKAIKKSQHSEQEQINRAKKLQQQIDKNLQELQKSNKLFHESVEDLKEKTDTLTKKLSLDKQEEIRETKRQKQERLKAEKEIQRQQKKDRGIGY